MKKAITIFGLLLVILSAPLAMAQTSDKHPIIPCGFSDQRECTFQDLIVLVNSLIDNLLLKIAVPLAVLTIAVAGLMYVFYSTNPSKRGQANDMLRTALWGFVVALGAYLFIKAIIFGLVDREAGSPGIEIMKLFNNR